MDINRKIYPSHDHHIVQQLFLQHIYKQKIPNLNSNAVLTIPTESIYFRLCHYPWQMLQLYFFLVVPLKCWGREQRRRWSLTASVEGVAVTASAVLPLAILIVLLLVAPTAAIGFLLLLLALVRSWLVNNRSGRHSTSFTGTIDTIIATTYVIVFFIVWARGRRNSFIGKIPSSEQWKSSYNCIVRHLLVLLGVLWTGTLWAVATGRGGSNWSLHLVVVTVRHYEGRTCRKIDLVAIVRHSCCCCRCCCDLRDGRRRSATTTATSAMESGCCGSRCRFCERHGRHDHYWSI